MRVMLAMVVISSSCCPPMQDETTTPTRPVVAPPPPARVVPDAPSAPPPPPPGPPVARTEAVVDTQVQGLTVADPYRWMEGMGNADHDTWLRAQGEYAAKELAKLPGRTALFTRMRELGQAVTAVFNVQLGGKRIFHNVFPANAQLAKLAVREPDGKTRILVDPELLGSAGTRVSLNAWSPSPDGTKLAYVISPGGGERGELHVLDVATGKDLPDVIERVWGEGSASWLPDGKRFFYTQLPVPKAGDDPMLNQLTRLHELGAPVAKDVVVIGRDATATWKLAPEEWPGAWVPRGSRWVIASAGGARPDMRVAIAKLAELDTSGASKTPWRTVAGYDDAVQAAIPHGDKLYLLTSKGAPNRRVVSVSLAKPDLAKAAVEIVEEPDATLVAMYGARDALYLVHMVNGLARISRWPWRGKATPLALPVQGWAPDLASELDRDGLIFQLETWLAPGTYYTYEPTPNKIVPAGLASSINVPVPAVVAVEVEATSADGTAVPLSILSRASRPPDTVQPTILTGYAAYGVSQTPGFSATRMAWIERGGVFAICHARGGGEKGRRWQDDGSREHKLAGVQDFIACAEYLVAHHYSSPAQLAAVGISMGGVLVGRALTERPDLFAAVHLGSPIVNPLRILAAENGANQKGELGDPASDAGYRSIAAMDPYLAVKPNTAYPAVIFTVGLNDHRVAPWMASKLAARLLAATTSKRPIVMRVDADSGHGIGNTRDQVFAERADVWSFFLAAFGDPEFVAH